MPRTYLKPTLIIILTLSFSFILSCSTTKDKKANHPSKLLREAKRFYKAGAALRAKDNINIIIEDFPEDQLHYISEEIKE